MPYNMEIVSTFQPIYTWGRKNFRPSTNKSLYSERVQDPYLGEQRRAYERVAWGRCV